MAQFGHSVGKTLYPAAPQWVQATLINYSYGSTDILLEQLKEVLAHMKRYVMMIYVLMFLEL